MWYIQINQYKPQKMNIVQTSKTAIKWRHQIKEPDKLDILYIFAQEDIQGSYNVQITVGQDTFHLGTLNNSTAAIQSEPNFPIGSGTKCYVSIEQKLNH